MARQVATHRKPTVALEPQTDERLRAYSDRAGQWRHGVVDAVLRWFLQQEPAVQSAITFDHSDPGLTVAMLCGWGRYSVERYAPRDDGKTQAPPLRMGNALFRLTSDGLAPPEFTDAEQDYLAELGRQIDAEYDTDAGCGTDAEHDVDTEDGEQTP